MTAVYKDADYLAAYKQKKRVWRGFYIITAVYLLLCLVFLTYSISLPYGHNHVKLAKWCAYIVTAVYVVIVFPYLVIKCYRVDNYYRLLTCISIGEKAQEKNFFYDFDCHALQKEKVDFTACMFERWDAKHQEWQERVAYTDPEKPLPPFENGDYVHYVLQSNFIIEYKILQKNALEFEEEQISAEDSDNTKGESL